MDAKAVAWVLAQEGVLIEGPHMVDNVRRVTLRCKHGHDEWSPRVSNLAYNHSWCPDCYGNRPLTIESMNAIAEERGGMCLSTIYHGSKTNLRWQCGFGHQWPATPNNIKIMGSWCPKCKINVGEELVRATLEEAFPGHDFDRTRRETWMEGLELDGYNEVLRLAFEYQGIQHYQRVEHFQETEEKFEAQLIRDALTELRCTTEFITLLVIPHTIGFLNLRTYVRNELESLGYVIAPLDKTDTAFYNSVRAAGPTGARQFARALEIITKKGGACLSTQYVGYRIPLRIRCSKGHEFDASLEAIDQPAYRGPRFCPECGGTRCQTDAELRTKVEATGYRYLGVHNRRTSDGRSRRYITVICPGGHPQYDVLWDNFKPNGVKPKKGCTKCYHTRSGGSKRNDITAWCDKYEITLADEEYKGQAAEHSWQCAYQHEFTAKMSCLLTKKGNPCPACWLIEFASDHDLDLLTQWDNTHTATTKLIWQCRTHGDEFPASRISLGRKKILCPTCG